MDLQTVTTGFSLFSLVLSFFAFRFSKRADSRSEKLFEAQKISLIQVTPISFEKYLYDEMLMGKLELQITNYTGFKASNLKVDANWENVWIREWMVAAVEGLTEEQKKRTLTEKELAEFNTYKLSLSQNEFNIEPNNSVQSLFQGAFTFDRNVKKIITLRTRWTSENGAQFDKSFSYELVSTEAFGAESLTLISLNDTK